MSDRSVQCAFGTKNPEPTVIWHIILYAYVYVRVVMVVVEVSIVLVWHAIPYFLPTGDSTPD